MPLEERVIQPQCLGAKPLDLLDQEEGTAHLAVATNSLIGALLQLASLVRHADDIFCDITEECQKVFDRSDKLCKKLGNIENCVKQLDAKNVLIPVGDLSSFTQQNDHHVTKHGFDCDLFTKENRPACIKDQYAEAEMCPSRVLRGADIYRKDGLCSSRLFRFWPVAFKEPKVKTPDLNLPRRSQSVFTFEKRYKRLKERPRSIHSTDDQYFSKEDQEQELRDMSESLCASQSSSLITIDTSGAGFERMEFLRCSERKIDSQEKEKKKKRRRTVSGVSDYVLKEIRQFEEKKKLAMANRAHPRDYSFDDIKIPSIDRDEQMAKYLDEIDAKMEERKEEEQAMKGPKFLKMFPCRRSKSLPRCLKLHTISKALAYDRQSMTEKSNSYIQGSCLSLSSMGSISSRLSRSTKRSSIISGKLKLLVTGNSGEKSSRKTQPRPKSLDLDAIDFGEESSSSLASNKMASMPDGMLSNSSLDSSKFGPGSYYNFESNTLPRTQKKNENQPWESNMPKDWTTSVKLREIRRRSKDDRQSSSGNWSGSSSNRHSLDSDVKTESMGKTTSTGSLGHDSGRDSPVDDSSRSRAGTESTGGYAPDDTSTVSGDNCSLKESKLDTDSWLQSLAMRAASREEVSSSSAETLTSLTKLTKQNIQALDLMMSPSKRRPCCYLDDEESSVYSLDGEGFYTSFHNDSGLRRSSGTLVDEDDLSPTRESQASNASFESVIHTSDTEKYAGLKRGGSMQQSSNNKGVLSKVTPPAPPPRTSSCKNKGNSKGENNTSSPDGISRQDSSMSESDQESIYMRLKMKTEISNSTIPLMCPISSDEESLLGKISPDNQSNLLDLNQNLNKTGETSDSSMFSVSTLDGSIHSDSNSVNDMTFDLTSLTSEMSCSTLCADDTLSDLTSKTLPKNFKTKPVLNDSYDYTKSWPRVHKKKDNLDSTPLQISGILKNSDRSFSGPKAPKSLNFSPVVNMFKPGTPQAVQMPLPQTSPEMSKDGSRKLLSPDAGHYKLSVPLSDDSLDVKNSEVPMKYQPVIVVKPGSRKETVEKKGAYVKLTPDGSVSDSRPTTLYATSNVAKGKTSGVSTFSTGAPNHYAVSPIKTEPDNLHERYAEKGQSSHSPLTATDSGYIEMPGNSPPQQNLSQNTGHYAKPGHGLGSMLSLESADSLNLTEGFNNPENRSDCSSPNLSNFEVEVLNTPTGSMDSLVDPSKFNGGFVSIDKSNLSTTVETIAISTNTTVSSYPQNDSINSYSDKSFRTFTGPVSPPVSSSTPCGVPSRNYATPQNYSGQSPSFVDNNPMSHVDKNERPKSSVWPQRRSIPSSKSMPSDMTRYTQQPGTSGLDRRRSSGDKIGAIVNLQNESPPEDTSLNRSESYRVAMGNVTRNSSYRVAMVESKSCPSFQNRVQTNQHQVASVAPNLRKNPSNVSSRSDNSKNSSFNKSINSPTDYARNNQSNRGSPSLSTRSSRSTVSTTSIQSSDASRPQRTSTYKPSKTGSSSSLSSMSSQLSKNGPIKASSSYYASKVAPPQNVNPMPPPEDFNRTDSYRFAVKNTHGTVSFENPDMAVRNSSYRVAISDREPVISDDRLSYGGSSSSLMNGRDIRRMGITDVDQVKGIPKQSLNHSQSASSVVKLRRPPKEDNVDPISVLSDVEKGKSNRGRNNKNRHSTSSTYICFDPIFEDRESLSGSISSLKTPTGSMSSLKMTDTSPDETYYFQKDSFYDKNSKVNMMSNSKLGLGSKISASSLFGRSKSKQKSSPHVTSKEIELEDDYRFTMV